jgi:hypothetical protein
MTTRRTWRIAIAVTTAAVLLGTLCLSEVVRYPRIARSAYVRHPLLLIAAGWREKGSALCVEDIHFP